VPNQPPAALIPESETEFTVDGMDIELTFVRDSNGKVTHFNVRLPYQDEFPAKKIN
jgi:hypothetical protein